MTGQPLRVLRVYHSAVVSGYRDRDRHLRRLGISETLVSPKRWNEGGKDVLCVFDAEEQTNSKAVRTIGRHPYVFLYDPLALIRTWRMARPDLVDVHEEPASLAVGELLLLRRLLQPRIPVALYSAQNVVKRYPPPFRWIERWALRTASAIYCCNSAAVDVLRAKGFQGEAVVLGLGIDAIRFSPREASERRAGMRLGYVGRLERHKGVHVLLEAMLQLPEDVNLAIVGDGPEAPSLKARTKALGLESRVRFQEFTPYGELPLVYRGFDAVVLPSVPVPGALEQFGRVAVEAMATATPVVASAVGALPEVVGPGGILIAPNDPAAIAGAVRRLLEDECLRSEIASRARAWSQRFDWSAIAERHRDIYERAARGR